MRRRGVRERSAPRARPARSSSACPATSRGPASTRSRSGRRCASCSSSAGGVPGGRAIQAILLGGAAGVVRRAGRARHAADVRGDARDRRDARLGRGHGLRRDGRPRRTRCGGSPQFFRDESCGQCVPCRVGTRAPGGAARAPRGRLAGRDARRRAGAPREIGQAMRDASICGLGQTAVVGDRDRRSASRSWWRCDATASTLDATGAARDAARSRRRSRRRILLDPPARRRDRRRRRRSSPPPPVELTIDGAPVTRPGRLDDPRRLPRSRGSTRRPSATSTT